MDAFWHKAIDSESLGFVQVFAEELKPVELDQNFGNSGFYDGSS